MLQDLGILRIPLAIELILLFMTMILLVHPFVGRTPPVRKALRTGGYLFLCLTFCWSVVLGALMIVYRLTTSL